MLLTYKIIPHFCDKVRNKVIPAEHIPFCHLSITYNLPTIWVKHLHESQEQNHMLLKEKQKQTSGFELLLYF